MSLKTRLQVSILALVAVIVITLSTLHLSAVIENRFEDASVIAGNDARQVQSFLLQRIETEAAKRTPPPADLEETTALWVEIAEQDAELEALLKNLMGASPVIIESMVTGPDNRILAASLEAKRGQKHAPLPSFDEFKAESLGGKLNAVFSGNQDYELALPLGAEDRTVFTVRLILSSVLLRSEIQPHIQDLALVSGIALLVSLLSAVVVSNLAVKPFERIGEIIDRISRGDQSDASVEPGAVKEVAAVASKLSLLGERFRGAQADAESLRGNIDQLLNRLEQAVLLFGRDNRLVMAGGAAERLIGGGRWEMMGRSLDEIFPAATDLGALIQSALHLRRNLKDKPVELRVAGADPLRLLVSVEIVEEFPRHERVGVLVTLREADPRRQIESQLDVSTRLAAISRLTSGAAHEIKNPLNSIALHVEILKSKLVDTEIGTAEIEVIAREITRLDRVVKSFLDFTRPVELHMEPFDLAKLVEELTRLIAPDAERRRVEVAFSATPGEAPIRADRDLLKQAMLNVLVNGIQAMEAGGTLTVAVEESGGEWVVSVRDEGVGIPEDAREKIYQLYYTTKGEGSGIGLAMTFQVVQLHGGTIEFTSEVGAGTEFRLQLPAAERTAPRNPPAAEEAAG